MNDLISRQQAIRWVKQECNPYGKPTLDFESGKRVMEHLERMPSAQPERKTGHWILDRSGAYCCDKCMEPCASYAMMKPRDKFCKMCGSRNEVR